MFKTIIGVLAGCALFTALATSLLLFTHGLQARPPGKLETRIVTSAKRWLFVGDKGMKSPLPANTENISLGRKTFSHYCFACHGLDGQSTGVPFTDAMSPPVPSLASPSVQAYSDGQLYWVIQNGLRLSGMPAARGILSDEEMWSIVLYLRHLPPAGSLGEPPAYEGEEDSAFYWKGPPAVRCSGSHQLLRR
jgi:mono/diheme cytochrome c family protein